MAYGIPKSSKPVSHWLSKANITILLTSKGKFRQIMTNSGLELMPKIFLSKTCLLVVVSAAKREKNARQLLDGQKGNALESEKRSTTSEPRKKPSYFPLYWMVNRDPYNGFL